MEFKNWIPEEFTFSDSAEVSLAENEKKYIKATLIKTNGKVFGPDGAAEILKINPKTLLSRMSKLGIQRK